MAKSMKTNAKAERVLDVALALLKEEGDYGVTMRQVAANAGMSLSNVQYYYKNKDALLTAMADRYFNACLDEMKDMQPVGTADTAGDVRKLLSAFLVHGLEVSEMCRIFREYWAISTRNEAIDAYLQQYYQQVVAILTELMRPAAVSEDGLASAVSIFVPFAEGYSITALSMPKDINRVTEDMTNFIVRLLAER